MFARVTRATVPPDKLDEGIATFRTTVLPSMATRPGYLGGLLLVDRQSGAARSVTYWEDEAALRASDAMAAEGRATVTQASGAQVGEPESYELVVQERVVTPRANVFVRANDIQGSIERIDDVLEFARQQVLPSVKSQRGWLSMLLMVNRQNGRSLLMSVWDSAANREASEAAVRAMREQGGATAGASTVEVSLYEAAVVELNAAAFPVGAGQRATA
jgi:heme-degrading monooxygenase HmoA